MNNLVREFLLRLEAKFAEDFENMSMSEWMIANTHLRKKPFSFEGYEFQKQIADDMHPNLVCIKCSQIGLTEVQLLKYLGFLMRRTAINGIFTLPTDIMFKRVSSTRVKPLIESEEVFSKGSTEKPVRQVGLYQLDQSFAFFTGNKESDATSINADILFHDEVDLSDQEMLGLFNSRLQGSELRLKQKFSTPTFIGYGIDGEFAISDQHEYMVRCTQCSHYNLPVFTPAFVNIPGLSSDLNDLSEIDPQMMESLDLSKAHVMCESCHHPLELQDPDLKQWVARHPGRTTRGYNAPLPISLDIGQFSVDYFAGFAERGDESDLVAFTLGNVIITNTSNTRPVSLMLHLVIDNKDDGSKRKLIASGIGPFGLRYRIDTEAAKEQARGVRLPDPAFECPIAIGPGTSVKAELVFLDMFGAKNARADSDLRRNNDFIY